MCVEKENEKKVVLASNSEDMFRPVEPQVISCVLAVRQDSQRPKTDEIIPILHTASSCFNSCEGFKKLCELSDKILMCNNAMCNVQRRYFEAR